MLRARLGATHSASSVGSSGARNGSGRIRALSRDWKRKRPAWQGEPLKGTEMDDEDKTDREAAGPEVKSPRDLDGMYEALQQVRGDGRVLITAKLADAILTQWNEGNRRRDEIAVQRYRRDMDAGRWLAGSVLAFGLLDDGCRLGDGQHRLAAQVASKTDQEYLVRAFTSREEFAAFVLTIDAGKARTLGDQLRIFELADTPGNAAAYERIVNAMQNFAGNRATRLSRQERMDFASQYIPQIKWALALPKREFKAHLLAVLVYAHAKHQRAIEALIAQVISGADLTTGSPALAISKAKVGWNDASNALDKERAMGLMMRVLYDAVAGRARTAAFHVPANSSRVAEAITHFVGAEAAEVFNIRQASRK
jgi:hypothetical protein